MPSVGAFGEAVEIVTDEGAPSPRRQRLTALENSWFEEHYSRSQRLREALPPLDPVEEQFWVYFYESRARWCSALFSINSFFLTLMLAVVNLAYPKEKQSAHFIELYVSIAGYLVISLTFLIFFFGIQYFPSFMFNSATKSAAQGKRRSEKQEQKQGESEGDGEGRSITGTARGLGIFLLLCRACTFVQTVLFFRSMGLHEHDEQFTYSPARIIFAIFLDQLQSMFVLDVVFPVPSFANVYLSLTILNHLALMAAHDMRDARATGLVTGLLLPIVIFADLTAPLAAYWVFVSQKNLYISLQAYKSTSVPTIKIVDRLASDCKEPVAAVTSVLLGQEFCDFRNTLQGSARRKAAEAVALLRGEDVRLSLLTDNMMFLTRIEKGSGSSIAPSTLHLPAIIEVAVATHQPCRRDGSPLDLSRLLDNVAPTTPTPAHTTLAGQTTQPTPTDAAPSPTTHAAPAFSLVEYDFSPMPDGGCMYGNRETVDVLLTNLHVWLLTVVAARVEAIEAEAGATSSASSPATSKTTIPTTPTMTEKWANSSQCGPAAATAASPLAAATTAATGTYTPMPSPSLPSLHAPISPALPAVSKTEAVYSQPATPSALPAPPPALIKVQARLVQQMHKPSWSAAAYARALCAESPLPTMTTALSVLVTTTAPLQRPFGALGADPSTTLFTCLALLEHCDGDLVVSDDACSLVVTLPTDNFPPPKPAPAAAPAADLSADGSPPAAADEYGDGDEDDGPSTASTPDSPETPVTPEVDAPALVTHDLGHVLPTSGRRVWKGGRADCRVCVLSNDSDHKPLVSALLAELQISHAHVLYLLDIASGDKYNAIYLDTFADVVMVTSAEMLLQLRSLHYRGHVVLFCGSPTWGGAQESVSAEVLQACSLCVSVPCLAVDRRRLGAWMDAPGDPTGGGGGEEPASPAPAASASQKSAGPGPSPQYHPLRQQRKPQAPVPDGPDLSIVKHKPSGPLHRAMQLVDFLTRYIKATPVLRAFYADAAEVYVSVAQFREKSFALKASKLAQFPLAPGVFGSFGTIFAFEANYFSVPQFRPEVEETFHKWRILFPNFRSLLNLSHRATVINIVGLVWVVNSTGLTNFSLMGNNWPPARRVLVMTPGLILLFRNQISRRVGSVKTFWSFCAFIAVSLILTLLVLTSQDRAYPYSDYPTESAEVVLKQSYDHFDGGAIANEIVVSFVIGWAFMFPWPLSLLAPLVCMAQLFQVFVQMIVRFCPGAFVVLLGLVAALHYVHEFSMVLFLEHNHRIEFQAIRKTHHSQRFLEGLVERCTADLQPGLGRMMEAASVLLRVAGEEVMRRHRPAMEPGTFAALHALKYAHTLMRGLQFDLAGRLPLLGRSAPSTLYVAEATWGEGPQRRLGRVGRALWRLLGVDRLYACVGRVVGFSGIGSIGSGGDGSGGNSGHSGNSGIMSGGGGGATTPPWAGAIAPSPRQIVNLPRALHLLARSFEAVAASSLVSLIVDVDPALSLVLCDEAALVAMCRHALDAALKLTRRVAGNRRLVEVGHYQYISLTVSMLSHASASDEAEKARCGCCPALSSSSSWSLSRPLAALAHACRAAANIFRPCPTCPSCLGSGFCLGPGNGRSSRYLPMNRQRFGDARLLTVEVYCSALRDLRNHKPAPIVMPVPPVSAPASLGKTAPPPPPRRRDHLAQLQSLFEPTLGQLVLARFARRLHHEGFFEMARSAERFRASIRARVEGGRGEDDEDDEAEAGAGGATAWIFGRGRGRGRGAWTMPTLDAPTLLRWLKRLAQGDFSPTSALCRRRSPPAPLAPPPMPISDGKAAFRLLHFAFPVFLHAESVTAASRNFGSAFSDKPVEVQGAFVEHVTETLTKWLGSSQPDAVSRMRNTSSHELKVLIVSGRLGQGAHRKDSPQPHVSPHAPSAHAAHAPSFSHAHSYYNEEAGRRASDVSLAEVFVSDGWGCSFASVEQLATKYTRADLLPLSCLCLNTSEVLSATMIAKLKAACPSLVFVQISTEMGVGGVFGLTEGRSRGGAAPATASTAPASPAGVGAGASALHTPSPLKPAHAHGPSSHSSPSPSQSHPSPSHTSPSQPSHPSPSHKPQPPAPAAAPTPPPIWSDPQVACICHEKELRDRLPFIARACVAATVQQLLA